MICACGGAPRHSAKCAVGAEVHVFKRGVLEEAYISPNDIYMRRDGTALFAVTGDVVAPVVAHAVLNGLQLQWIAARREPVSRPPSVP